jgi:hypothetical protein
LFLSHKSMASYQLYINKLESNIHVNTYDSYVLMNDFRSNVSKISKPSSPKVSLSPNSMINNFDDISSNLRSHIARSVK